MICRSGWNVPERSGFYVIKTMGYNFRAAPCRSDSLRVNYRNGDRNGPIEIIEKKPERQARKIWHFGKPERFAIYFNKNIDLSQNRSGFAVPPVPPGTMPLPYQAYVIEIINKKPERSGLEKPERDHPRTASARSFRTGGEVVPGTIRCGLDGGR
ncbi:hypothetical protein [Amaricoccus sp. W119]|uniref:hypothetical protein n=1 Tax=Amaricoccus sp. W119 TaxID=3391833 RepID=UPI0039A75483